MFHAIVKTGLQQKQEMHLKCGDIDSTSVCVFQFF